MIASKLSRTAILVVTLAASGTALASGSHPQTHHCKLSDGTMDMKKTHKQCTAAKGTWAKDAPTTPAKDAPAKDPKATTPTK